MRLLYHHGLLMGRLLAIWRAWSVRTRVLIVGGVVALVAGGGAAAYLVLKRDADVECPPPCTLEVEEEPERREVIKTVSWPVYGYDDQRTRYLPTKVVKPPYGQPRWTFDAGNLLEFSPIVVRGTLYLIDKNAVVHAIDARTGKVDWKQDIGALNASAPAYADGRLYAVSLEPGQAVALRARDGKVLWRKELPGRSETSPLVYGRSVIVGSESGDVFALDLDNGNVRWQVSTAGNVKGGLALDDGIAYGANYAGEVFAIRAVNGDMVWETTTQGLSFGRGGPVYSTPAVAFGRVFLGSIDGRVYSFDADTGKLWWSHSTGDWVYPAPAVADTDRTDPTVYIGSKDQNFYALDAKTGEVRWERDLHGIVLGAASVIGDVVYVAAIGPNIGSFGFDVKSGKKVFESPLGEYNPVISDGRRLYLTGTSKIEALEHKERKRAKDRRRDGRKQGGGSKERQRHAKAGGSKAG
jgi:outer membrane protein assembly factor BamB